MAKTDKEDRQLAPPRGDSSRPAAREDNPARATACAVVEDARIVRSRDGLRDALLALLEVDTFERISIRDITDVAGVGYRTFFRLYAGKEALLEEVATEACAQLVELTLPVYDASASQPACVALCTFVHDKRPLWTALLTGGAAAVVREELLRRSRAITEARPAAASWLPADLSSTLAVSTIIEILTWWLRQSRPLPIERVAEIMDRMAIAPAEKQRR